MNPSDTDWMRIALRLARRGLGNTSPNPMVGAVVVGSGKLLGQGWHHRAGQPHAEVEALRDAERRGNRIRGATLYVTLEPCCTTGRTPPCTEAILSTGIRRVVVAAVDPNPRHSGRAFPILRKAGIVVESGILAEEANRLNEAFNHWIVHRTPWVTLKAAMTLDGRIATATGESQWITGAPARQVGMRLRRAADAILVGIGTVLADDPSLTLRRPGNDTPCGSKRRLVLDTRARTPLTAKLVNDAWREKTTIVVGESAPARRVAALARKVRVVQIPERDGHVNLSEWLPQLGAEGITSLLVEGGGELHASFLEAGYAHRVAFFYAPLLLGGVAAKRAVAGTGFGRQQRHPTLEDLAWRRVGSDLYLSARVVPPSHS